ncbi:hypothetical protein DM02DRAFT_719642 [Periconia macrospinosa]|uniref:F-box domain-containing protein n=1 Tax=Periconia macrospinosa TaxID=97972 RepID=A0A2V1DJN5_9PLEO|nr:hypothetical protein DM02DRAFT_719642 [Periconia macrospinosa]
MTADDVGQTTHGSSIERLPRELLDLIFGYLSVPELKDAALVSKKLYQHASKPLWHHVVLVDKWTLHLNDQTRHLYGDRGQGEPDEHDDTPIIEKLHFLATNPTLAANVHVLTHRCHLPAPNIFSELPVQHFHADTLSQDPRLHALLLRAIPNLVNVHTLRIIYGHYHITRILLSAFLNPHRPQRLPLRKLWLESCSLTNIDTAFDSPEYASKLQSIRLRRLRAETKNNPDTNRMHAGEFRLSRAGHSRRLHNGAGGWFWSTVEYSTMNAPPRWVLPSTEEMKAKAESFDQIIWEDLSVDSSLINGDNLVPLVPQHSPINPIKFLIEKSAKTLTSLNLDWILWRKSDSLDTTHAFATMQQLSQQRFPHLRAFQLRNTVVSDTVLPDGVFLLEDMFLDFMEAHPKLQCLAWPIDRFYSHAKPSTELQTRTRDVVAHLGNTIIDLRLDNFYSGDGETFTDDLQGPHYYLERIRRRRFIAEFAPYMKKVEQLKIEGGIARDEKREIIRALHYSPLKKLVLIGVCFPVGNTWGPRGEFLAALDPGPLPDPTLSLEREDYDAILAAHKSRTKIPLDFEFRPKYGWDESPAFLHTIGQHHASTIEELKLCGYNGAPILSYMTPITLPILYPLRFFHNLKTLIMSFWLLTHFEDSHRDTEIIQSWMDTRSPASTALVITTPPASPSPRSPVDPAVMPAFIMPNTGIEPRAQEYNRWAVALKTRFRPSALAYRVAEDIAPHLSPRAKARPGGVRVRACFSLGTRDEGRQVNDIFDLDIRIGANGQVLEFIGPREEVEKGRLWEKLEARRWF